jgi:hypothetical protein
MWKIRQQALLAAVSLAVVAAGASAGANPGASAFSGAHGVARPVDRPVDPTLARDRAGTVTLRDDAPVPTFVAQDGLTYQASPPLVEGGNHTVFFGEEFDAACAFGTRFDKALVRLADLARMIEQSGRRVVFTVAPNKSAVNKADLASVVLPHGSCDARGITHQDKALDSFHDRFYLPMRKRLAARSARGVKEYWRVDTHWTSIGATEWAYQVASALDPRLANRQSYRRDTESLQVNLAFLGLTGEITETARGRATTTKVKVGRKRGANVFDPDVPSPTVGWTSAPRQRTWPGRTLLLGDSFTFRSLDPLMHLFRNGEFLWIGNTPRPDLVDGIRRADTVVIEVVQRYLAPSLLNTKQFHEEVGKALAKPRP